MPSYKMTEENRFAGVQRLYGSEGFDAIRNARFMVVGVGGVGSWAAEALVRTGVRHLTLIDMDCVAVTNTNRQLQALDGNYGKPKIEVLEKRFLKINPELELTLIQRPLTEENVSRSILFEAYVLDCIDDVRSKAALIDHCRKNGNFIVTSGGAGGRIDPSRIRCDDLSRVKGDPLLSSVRQRLRKSYGFPTGAGKPRPFHVLSVYTDEPLKQSRGLEREQKTADGEAFAGFGTAVAVTAAMGMHCAALAINASVQSK